MKKTLLLAALVLAGCSKEPKSWSYIATDYQLWTKDVETKKGRTKIDDWSGLNESLRIYSDEGWELFTFAPTGDRTFVAVWRRSR